jgi:predicted phage terminase large subunit-like protein
MRAAADSCADGCGVDISLERILSNALKDQDLGPVFEPESVRLPYYEWYRETIPRSYVIPPHIKWLCTHVAQRIIDGEWQRVILTLPPQHAKSDTFTRRLPVYWGENFPGDNVLITGYSQTFAETQLSLPARDLALERGVLGDRAALNYWKFENGGSVSARGVGSPPTGLPRLKLVIIDDPISSREDAASETIREKIWDWYRSTIVQRYWPDTRVILIATRWHEEDLIGKLLVDQPDEWVTVNLPAIATENDPIGRVPGDALWPAQKPLGFLEAQKIESGPYEFEALFQGNPTPREGSFFKVANLEIVDEAPAGGSAVRAWDIAATEGAGDYTVGVKMTEKNGIYYVLDVRRDRWSTDNRDKEIRLTAQLDGVSCRIRGPQDPGAAGKSAAQAFVRLLAGFSVKTKPISGDKQVRADPFSSQVNAGNVRLVRGAWNKAYVEELRQFPMGSHDDQVDASADAFGEIQRSPIAMIQQTTFHPQPKIEPLILPQVGNGSPVRRAVNGNFGVRPRT